MERVDVVELEPLVLDVARACAAVNHDVLRQPEGPHHDRRRARDAADHARALRHHRVGAVESVSAPASPACSRGSSTARPRDRLTDDGVFVQWVQALRDRRADAAHDLRDAGRRCFRRSRRGRPTAAISCWWRPSGRAVYDAAALRARIAEEPFKTALANAWRAVDIHGLLAHYIANDALARAIAGTPRVEINTDDRNIVEFGLARSSAAVDPAWRRRSVGSRERWARRTAARHRRRHRLAGGRDRLGELRSSGTCRWTRCPPCRPSSNSDRQALRRYHAGDIAGARELWRLQSEPPRDPSELAMAADLEAEARLGHGAAAHRAVARYQPAEADTVLATLRMRQSRLDEAASALESAFARLSGAIRGLSCDSSGRRSRSLTR